MSPTEKTISLSPENLSVSYYDNGQTGKPAIIFIHGYPFHKAMWEKQLDFIGNDYRAIAYDIRGYGNSETGMAEFSIDMLAFDLIDLVRKLKVEKAVICGLSMGGYIALNAILKEPELFNGLILCDTQCIADSEEVREKRYKTIDHIKQVGLEKYSDEMIRNLFAPVSFSDKPDEVEIIREMIAHAKDEVVFNTLRALASRIETCSMLIQIRVPALIMVGKEDKLTPPSASELMHERISGSRLEIIEGAGHLTNLENHTVFNGHLADFLRGLGK